MRIPVFLAQVEFLVIAVVFDTSSGEHSGFQGVSSLACLDRLRDRMKCFSLNADNANT